MTKKYLIIIGIVIVVVIGLLSWRNKNLPSQPISIRSADGIITLEIPRSSIPPGQNSAAIGIQALPADAFWGIKKNVPGPAYKLVPDGLVFTSPIILRAITKSTGVIPQLLHVSQGGTEFIQPTIIRLTADDKMVAEFALAHFSEIGLDFQQGTFRYELTSGGEAPVGQTLPWELNITVNQQEQYFMRGVGWSQDVARLRTNAEHGLGYREARKKLDEAEALGGYYYQVAPGTAYTVSAFAVENNDNILSPATLNSLAKEQKEYQPFRYAAQFTCSRSGTSHPAPSRIDIIYRMRTREHIVGRDDKVAYQGNTATLFLPAKDYTCLAARAEPVQERIPVIEDSAATTLPRPSKPSEDKIMVCGLPGGPACPKR